MLNSMKLFKAAHRFYRKLAEDPLGGPAQDEPLEYGTDEYWNLAEGLVSTLDRDKYNHILGRLIEKEVKSSDLSYTPLVVQLTMDHEDGGVWYFQNGHYEPANHIKSLELPSDLKKNELLYFVDKQADQEKVPPDIIVGSQNQKQYLFVREGKNYVWAGSGVIPVTLTSESFLSATALRMARHLHKRGEEEPAPATQRTFEGARTMDELERMYPESAPDTEREPRERWSEPEASSMFNNMELSILLAALKNFSHTPVVLNKQRNMELVHNLFDKLNTIMSSYRV